jgi:hypothetical protein
MLYKVKALIIAVRIDANNNAILLA